MTKIKAFVNRYNWEGINFPSEKDDWKKFEKNNLKIALNVLYAKKEKKDLAYVSKHNSNREKQIIFLMIPNEERWHYMALLTRVIYIVRIVFFILQQKTNLNLLKNYVKIKFFVTL